uniref:[histone H3]-trimethyl-L-lysine(4) demethylase n=1 Tax=Schistosoma haematobium TaxID=6185 RepID=A0A094ZW49_SCHHA
MSLDFIRPPSAPVFNPTTEEFTDPISYVQRISPGWKPPFSVDQQNFTFVPRVQELTDVSAYNRVRYHFITSLINFWEAQDVTLFVPQIKGKSIDIYRLWKQVKCTGGYQTVCEKKLWCKICGEIGLPAIPSFASALCSHYKKYLLPYDTFIADESMVSLEETEAEFWRLVGSEDTGVSVEYGADLNAREHGSGFPTSRPGRISQKLKHYVTSPWNLNNTPLLDNSALRFLPRNISGMIIPWCYVGMAFSCFCWHTEDHWSYSINYLHMGEPKTWYGVPTNYADAFELAMRSEVPELFVNSPDLLHHMTTMVSPSRLQAHGVPVYRTDQMVGEFVVTFPRAFHAGFNQGFNFAEAVNFCPADWLEYGLNCIEHYALLHRTPVFSHAELLCRMAKSVEPLSVEFLTVITKQLGDLLTTERSLRRHLARIGVRLTERMVFENSEDEKRECDLCRTTLYLSSLGCKCSESMVCLAHYQIRTCCPRDSQIMRYRYDLDELTEFKEKLQSKLIEFEQWKNQIENEVFSAMQNSVDTIKISSALKTATTTNTTTTEIKQNKSGDNLKHQTDLLKLNNHLKLSICDNVDNSVNNSSTVSSNNTKENDHGDIIVDTKLDVDNKNELATVGSKPSSSISLKTDQEQHHKLTLSDLNKLLKLGRARQYPNTLVERLNHVVHTISECSSVVRKLITSYKNACESMKITQETEMKSVKYESTDSEHEEDDDHDFENDDADNDNGTSERKELTQNTDRIVHNISHTSTSSRSNSETDDEVSIEDSRNSSGTSFTKNSRRLSRSSFHGGDDDNDDYTERLEQREEDKMTETNQNEQLTLNEFASLVKLASTLPVILPEYKDLQEFADHITRWRSEVRDLLVNLNKKPFFNNNNNGNNIVDVNDGCIISSISDINTTTNDNSSLYDPNKIELQLRSVLPSVIKVAEYINVGNAIDIELPELNQLKRVHECLTWLEKVDKALNYKSNSVQEKIEKYRNTNPSTDITIISKPTLSNLCDLQIQGSHVASAIAYVMNISENVYSSYNFSSHSLLDTVLSIQSRHLLETISTVKLIEERLNEIIQAKPGSLSLNSVKEQLIIAEQLPIQLTTITNVQSICEKAEKYEKQFELFARLLLQNISLSSSSSSSSSSSLNEYNRNTFQQEQCYTEVKQKKEEEANSTVNNNNNQCTMDQEILDEVGLGSVNSTPINWQSYFNTLEDSIQDCVIKFPQNDSIRKLLSDLNKFHEKLSKLFIRPQSTRSLLEILLPRSASALEWLIRLDGDPDIIPDSYRNNFNLDANNCPPTTYKRHTRSPHFQSLTYKSLCKDNVQEFAKISNVSNWEQVYSSTYNRFVEAEVSLMHYLRSTNMRKSRAKNQEKIVYCICRQPGLTSFMLQCELCRDWVHGRCVTLPALKDSETERMRYICPRCECSLRPDLKQVLNFVSELNNLSSCNNDSNHDQTVNSSNNNHHEISLCFHQFPEFVAVQLLCVRAISFIKHIQTSIASNTELKQALSDYEHFSNMTMPSINLIEENISEELMSSPNCNDTSQILINSKKLYLPEKGTSLDLACSSKSSLGSDSRSSNTTVRSMISHSQDYLDIDYAKTQTAGSYLPTARPRAGNISMPAKSPWKVMNSTMSKFSTTIGNNSLTVIANTTNYCSNDCVLLFTDLN